jgi:hypothetical protein
MLRENEGARVSQEHDTQPLKIEPTRNLEEKNGKPQEPPGRLNRPAWALTT